MNRAVIVAGGSGLRMNSDLRKQYLNLKGQPVLRRTLEVFSESGLFDKICLVVPMNDTGYIFEYIISKPLMLDNVYLTAGGSERQESVYNGLNFFEDINNDDIIVIHDGVRPLVSKREIIDSIRAAEITGAAAVSVPAYDTIKEEGEDGMISRTLPREKIWHAQTPQAFKYETILKAHITAKKNGWHGTDDASLVEMAGGKVRLVEGSRKNIKITTPEDLVIAEALLSA